jgi:hypothetical protein
MCETLWLKILPQPSPNLKLEISDFRFGGCRLKSIIGNLLSVIEITSQFRFLGPPLAERAGYFLWPVAISDDFPRLLKSV